MSHAKPKQTPAAHAQAQETAQESAQQRQAAPDEHAGQGGLYTRQGGARQLVERTGLAAPVPAPVPTAAKE